ncbi:MAG: sigma-70 family RNA polymerase sigma factor [Myxococcales bacterium]|nr:sigma-70 family RNA polymerase sigma factor [Myxococcales bacterium]
MAIDGAQVEALYRQFGPAIYRRCLKLLRDPAEAEDATQEVFVLVCRNLERFTYGDSPLPWVYRIATRHCLNVLRHGSRGRGAAAKLLPPGASDLQSALSDRQLASRLLSCFDERTGLIAIYHLVDGMTQEEVAQALGVSRRTVVARLGKFFERAREYLRQVA